VGRHFFFPELRIGEEGEQPLVEQVMDEPGSGTCRQDMPLPLARSEGGARGALSCGRSLILDELFEGLDLIENGTCGIAEQAEWRGHDNRYVHYDLNLVSGFADCMCGQGHGVIAADTDIFLQVEALKASNIDPPILTELFLGCTRVQVDVPVHVDQAASDLVRLVKNR
jgi:hypothetical protein